MRYFAVLVILAGCAGDESILETTPSHGSDGKADSSYLATVLDFSFDARVTSDDVWSNEQTIRDQLLFTIGHLNADSSVGRLDRLVLSNVHATQDGGKTTIAYHAEMPVAWGSKTNLPTSYAFRLPVDMSSAAQSAFTQKYKSSCVEWGAHDVDDGSMWYYYRPRRSGCSLAAGEVVDTTATVKVSPVNTTGKYPEMHKVWEDGVLNVVSVFGKYEDGATTDDDAGIEAYNTFVAKVAKRLAPSGVTTTPAAIPDAPGVGTPDITFEADLPGGRKIHVVALLVDNVRTTDPHFTQRYEELSTRADLIAYNGHAGLGQNVRALAKRGQWTAGQYVIVFMNGCDTFAYVDGSLAQTRAAVNPDDPTGTKYMELVVNAMPAFFASDASASMAMIDGLLAVDAPKTYEQIFQSIDSSQVVLVTGENDNVYYPGYSPGGGAANELLRETASVSHGELLQFSADAQAGTYVVTLGDDVAHPGGDADLYVKTGAAPTTGVYDCRPWLDGNNESCTVTLAAPGKIFAGVHGYSAQETHFTVVITRAP